MEPREGRSTMTTMPRPAKMTVRELKRIIKAAGLANMSEVSRVLGIARSHLYRLLDGADINEAMALLIRDKLPAKSDK